MRIEDKLIIELCRKNGNRKQIESLAGETRFNIGYFFKIIDKHLIKALVLTELLKYRIPDKLKDRVIPEAKTSLAETALSDRAIRDEYVKTAGILNRSNIDTLLMKGPSLNFSSLRYSRDLDILVHEDKLLEAIEVLKETGYRYIGNSINFLLNSEEKKDLALQLNWNNQYQLFNEETGLMIELHTNLFERDRAYRVALDSLLDNIDSFWENKKWNSELKTYVFSTEDLLLLMCMHSAIKRSPASNTFVLRNIVDIENLIDKNLDWDVFINKVKKCRLSSSIYFSLSLTASLFGTIVPAYVLNALRDNSLGKELFIERIHAASFQSLEGSSLLFSNIYKMISPFIYRSSISVKLKNLLLIPVLFPPKWRMAHLFNIMDSNPLVYLGYLLNPFRWIYLVSRNLFRRR